MSESSFNRAVAFTLKSEGPMSNNAIDPGGLTKYGISKRSYPTVDIAALTEEQAIDIYYTDYWLETNCDKMPFNLGLAVFECAVNQGVGTATRALQKALGVVDDGIFGPLSRAALSHRRQEQTVLTSFLALRVQKYAALMTLNPALYEENNHGWYKRLFLCTITGAQG